MATVSPALTWRLMPLTASTAPSSVRKRTLQVLHRKDRVAFAHPQRSFGSSASRRPSPTKFSANSVETRKKAGKNSSQLAAADVLRAGRDQHAPAGHRLLHAEPEEGQEALQDDHLRHQQRHVDDDGAEQVGDDVAKQDAALPDAQRLGRRDIFLPPDRQRLAAHDARHVEPQHRADRQEHQHEIAPEEHHQHDDEEDEGQGIEHVDDAHHDLVGLAAEKAGGGAVEHADHHGDKAGKQPDGQRDAAGHQRARQQIAADIVGAEQEILLLDRGAHHHAHAVRRQLLDLGVVEGVGTVDVAHVALVDLLRRR